MVGISFILFIFVTFNENFWTFHPSTSMMNILILSNWRKPNVFIIDCNLNESWHGVSLCNDPALPSVWFKIAIYNVCPQALLHQVTIVLLPINSPATFHKMFEIFCSFNFMEDIQYFGWQKKDNSRKFSILKFSVSSFCHCAKMTTRQKSKKVPVPVSFQQIQMNAGAMEHPISSFKWNVVVPKYSIPNLFPVQDIRRKFVHG